MHAMWKSIVLLISCCRLALLVVGGCPYKECQCYGTYINCIGLGLASMPIYYSTNDTGYLTLALDTNQITEIPAGSLPDGLSEISLIDNPITTIDDYAFNSLSTTLESLYFMNARLSKIPDAFLHLDSLEHLNIIGTNVQDWNIGAMAHIGVTLQTLNIESVGLTEWPVWLYYCHNLNELNLNGNSISSIPDNAFEKMSTSLLTLTLSNNNFTSTPKSLSSLHNVISLALQNNKISNITCLPQSNKLSGLTLNNNQISDAEHLSSVLRSYVTSLSSLNLAYNHLAAIPDVSFLTLVDDYDLSHNQISDPASGKVHSGIYVIDLSYNLLPSIPIIYKELQSVTSMSLSQNVINVVLGESIPHWIMSLDLRKNLITELSDTSFPVNSQLQQVNLDYNPIVKISNLAFKNLPVVNILSMQYTKLTRLPLSLAYLRDIRYLDISNNPDLVCTCLEKSLKTFITSDIEVSGDCGNIRIYDFMSLLSPGCP